MPLVRPSTDFDFCSIILPTSMDTSLLVVWVGVQVWGWLACGRCGGDFNSNLCKCLESELRSGRVGRGCPMVNAVS